MKILKPGKVEQRKFVCKECGCEFVGDPGDKKSGGLMDCANICCDNILTWDNGEPYEEPTPTQTDRERLAQLLVEAEYYCNFGERADHLMANGVTFKEG